MKSPYTKRRSAQFRGPSTSDDYNKRIEENYKDLVTLFNRARLSEVEVTELNGRLMKELLSMARAVDDLDMRIETLEGENKRLTFHSMEQVDSDRFDGDPTFEIPEEDKLSTDTQHGILTLPLIHDSSMSRLFYITTEGKEVIPSTLEMRVVGDPNTADNPMANIDTSDPQFALLRKPGLIWERNVIVETPNANDTEVTLYVKVPTDLFTTNKANAVLIHSFPYFGTTIKEISYSLRPDPILQETDGYTQFNSAGHFSGEEAAKGWVIPGGWDGIHEGDDAAVNTGPRIYYFGPKQITALKIVLHQDDFYIEGSQVMYSYGLSRLDLRFNKFLSEGRGFIRFDAPDGETISSIHNVQPEIWNVNPADLTNVFEYKTVWETAPDSGFYTETPVTNSNRVWIEVTLKNTEGWTPALSGLIVDYS